MDWSTFSVRKRRELFWLEKKSLRENYVEVYKYLKEGSKEAGVRLFSWVLNSKNKTNRNTGGSTWIQGNIFCADNQTLAQVSQRDFGVFFLGGIQKSFEQPVQVFSEQRGCIRDFQYQLSCDPGRLMVGFLENFNELFNHNSNLLQVTQFMLSLMGLYWRERIES